MMTILEEVQDQGGEDEPPKTGKYDLSQQNLPLATPCLPVKWGWDCIRWPTGPLLAQTHPTLQSSPIKSF